MQTVDMEATTRESEPFKNLTELYTSLNNLKLWPTIIELRESTEYVFRGSDIHLPRERLERTHRDSQPRTIICHDMKGGYIEDRFIDGCKTHDAYVFYHWSIVDTFIYFSHHFVTVPPYGWINAAHTHGVKILGTVITENSKGAAIWDEILESKEAIHKFVNALIHIAKFYKFEGWLLNVENRIKPEHVDNLIYFVKHLTDNIHEEIDGSEIIWYDSVTNKGELKWQNELNNENKEFFLSCDGIFLNYNWTDSRLASSHILAKNLNRDVHDVYVGLDVWGRGCPGGGGFNSAYALDKIRQQDLSVAIFAPGWTHEYFGPQTFCTLENTFWAQLLPYLYIHVPIYDNEKFQTSFCRGAGIAYYSNGEIQFEMQVDERGTYFDKKCFYNLAMQQPQISVPSAKLKFISSTQHQQTTPEKSETSSNASGTTNSKEPIEFIYENAKEILRICKNIVNIEVKSETSYTNDFELCDQFSYEGGGCLKLITRDVTSYHRLFITHIDFEHEIQASIVYAEGEITSIHNQPILVLGNQAGNVKIFPSQFWEINSQWKKCVYNTNLRAINEIGVMFLREGDCYLGEIVLDQKQQQRVSGTV